MSQQMTLEQADAVIMDLHKRAFLGRLAQHGIEPETEKEAQALLDLGVSMSSHDLGGDNQADTNQYGDGVFSQIKQAFDKYVDNLEIAPGVPAYKQAANEGVVPEPKLPSDLIKQAYEAAYQLAHDPVYQQAAIIKRAAINEMFSTEQDVNQQQD
jgi:hypothetical protein